MVVNSTFPAAISSLSRNFANVGANAVPRQNAYGNVVQLGEILPARCIFDGLNTFEIFPDECCKLLCRFTNNLFLIHVLITFARLI